MSTTIVCPSGMSLIIRGMKGRELKIISDSEARKNGTFLDRVLRACVETVVDPGPYTVDEKNGLDWDKVLSGDRIFITIQIRVATFGPLLSFKAVCGDCHKRGDYDADLTDLRVQALNFEDQKAFRDGTPLSVKVPTTGETIDFRLTTGDDEKKILKMVSVGRKISDDSVINMLTRKIQSVSGVDNIRGFLEDLSLGDITSLIKEMSKRECGVDTSIEMACPNCGTSSEVSVPVGSGPFWLPVQ